MNLPEAQRVFSLRYYQWALDDALTEYSQGWQTVGKIGGTMALATVRSFEQVGTEQRLALAKALVKRFHKRSASEAGDSLTVQDEQLLQWKDSAVLEIGSQLAAQKAGRRPISRSRLRRMIRGMLPSLCGPALDESSKSERFRCVVGGWIVTTQVVYSSTPLYVQFIRRDEHSSLQEGISLLSWLGFSGQTVWDMVEAGEEEAIASTIYECCGRFLTAVSDLVP